jgi:hypothetical protein
LVEHVNGTLQLGRNGWIPPRAACLSCSATVAATTNLKYVLRVRVFLPLAIRPTSSRVLSGLPVTVGPESVTSDIHCSL